MISSCTNLLVFERRQSSLCSPYFNPSSPTVETPSARADSPTWSEKQGICGHKATSQRWYDIVIQSETCNGKARQGRLTRANNPDAMTEKKKRTRKLERENKGHSRTVVGPAYGTWHERRGRSLQCDQTRPSFPHDWTHMVKSLRTKLQIRRKKHREARQKQN